MGTRKVCYEDTRELFGGVSQGTFDDMKALKSGEETKRTLEPTGCCCASHS
jgi:hypothetical protein